MPPITISVYKGISVCNLHIWQLWKKCFSSSLQFHTSNLLQNNHMFSSVWENAYIGIYGRDRGSKFGKPGAGSRFYPDGNPWEAFCKNKKLAAAKPLDVKIMIQYKTISALLPAISGTYTYISDYSKSTAGAVLTIKQVVAITITITI